MADSVVIIWLFVAGIVTSIISAVVGMAGGVTLLSIMALFLPWQQLVPIHGIAQLTSNSSRAFYLRQYIVWRIFLPFLVGVPLGAFVAVFLVVQLSSQQVPLLLIALLIFYVLFKPKKMPKIQIPAWSFVFVGVISGFLGILVGATGPLLAVFFLRDDLNKEQIIATKAISQFATHVIKIPSFLFLGFAYQEHWPLIVVLVVAALVGTRMGVFVLGKVNDRLFLWLYQTALFLAAIRILYKVALP